MHTLFLLLLFLFYFFIFQTVRLFIPSCPFSLPTYHTLFAPLSPSLPFFWAPVAPVTCKVTLPCLSHFPTPYSSLRAVEPQLIILNIPHKLHRSPPFTAHFSTLIRISLSKSCSIYFCLCNRHSYGTSQDKINGRSF